MKNPKQAVCEICSIQFTVKPGTVGRACSPHCGQMLAAQKIYCSSLLTKQAVNVENLERHEKSFLKSQKSCLYCNTKLPPEKKYNKFCSRSCSSSHTNNTRNYIKSTKLVKCSKCDQLIEPDSRASHGICDLHRNEYEAYRKQCVFRFRLKKYKIWFEKDINLYNELSNLTEARDDPTKDHTVSVYYGYMNKVDPTIISHPANCKILSRADNSSKRDNSSITIDDLLLRIKQFEEYYK